MKTKPPKIETINQAKVRHLVDHFKKGTKLTDDDPIVKRLRRDCLFALQIGREEEEGEVDLPEDGMKR